MPLYTKWQEIHNNKTRIAIYPMAVVLMATLLSSCSAIAGIFKAGAVVGVIAVVVVIVVIFWIFSMFRGKN